MQLQFSLVGAQANEQRPGIALYALDTRGKAKKIAPSIEDKLSFDTDAVKSASLLALGPDVADPGTLDSKSLITFHAKAQITKWEKEPIIEIPAQRWRPWFPIRICLTGTVHKCYPFFRDKFALLRSIALGTNSRYLPLRHCAPVCNGVVEVWETTCCCFPFILEDVPHLIAKLKIFLAENPLMFPPAPRPGTKAPVAKALKISVDRALAKGNADLRFVPNTQLHQDLQVLESSSAAEAVTYFQAHPSLWRIWCHCTSAKLAETPLGPDGTFQYCYNMYLFPRPSCGRSYFYKVKQSVGGAWSYIYDGSAASQHFLADETANIDTFLGSACGIVQPPAGTDFVNLQQIGGTPSYLLHSNYGGVDSLNHDLTQTGQYSVQTPSASGGLVDSNNAPWCSALSFMLYFDPGMEALGAYYYRLSVAPADLSGNPVGAMQPIQNAIAWTKYIEVIIGGIPVVETVPVTLGPNSVVNGSSTVAGLFKIPYYSAANQWESGQFHQYYDTTTLNAKADPATTPGPGNGRFLLALEIFDQTGNRLVPIAPAAGSGDKQIGFQYLRLLTASGLGSTASVPQAALTHLFWADNRRVHAEIDSFSMNGVVNRDQCQFLTGKGTDAFQVNYRAYHAVLGDNGNTLPSPAVPNPLPPASFMDSFTLTWERGLNGPTGYLDSGGDIDMPPTRDQGAAQPSPAANGLLSKLFVPPPTPPPTSCAFAITLSVTSKHTDGSGHPTSFDATDTSSVVLAVA